MAGKVDIIIEICAVLAEHENLTLTVRESFKGAGIAGLSALVGGLLGGKQGLLIGGALGSAAGYVMTADFKSVPQVIRKDMTADQKEKLFRSINAVLKGHSVTNVTAGLTLLSKDTTLKSDVLSVLSSFLENDMGLSLSM